MPDPTLQELRDNRPATGATWTADRQGQCDGLATITVAYLPPDSTSEPALWFGTVTGKIIRWGAGPPVATLPRRIVTLAARDGALLAQTDKRDVYLLDATTGKQRALWKQSEVSATLKAITPHGRDVILSLADAYGHPSERSARVCRVAVGQAAEAGVQIAITQGESIVCNGTAVYAEVELGHPARIPFDGSPATPISNAEIYSLLLADDPPGWRVHSAPEGLRLVREGAPDMLFPRAETPVGLCFLEGGRWLATLSLAGTLGLWDTGSGCQIATTQVEPRSQMVRQGHFVVIAGPSGALRWWVPTVADATA